MKKITLACFLCLGVVVVVAQQSNRKWQFSVGASASLPSGKFSNYYNTGYGGEAEISYLFNEKFSWYVTSGYYVFTGKKNTYSVNYGGIPFNFDYTSPKIGYIPILGGPRYTIGNFSLGIAAGVGIYNFKNEGNTYNVISDTTGISFTYSPQIAYTTGKFKIAASYTSSTVKLDAQFSSYVDLKNAAFIGIKLFYQF
ncbi:hypothetical protein ACFOW1_10700 [Parasediminibacterium paludis]|uniref:Outer membrane protein beta-barrel domain-containing protein n=1 Tax=Parasediminibacterium paludis TaxID=908966 RepID=A0ABV8PWJ3_9BACT